ncbi:hypothetical protein [Sediminitomix flava]|nr:hypothetical protein [Sediminitomix flava]
MNILRLFKLLLCSLAITIAGTSFAQAEEGTDPLNKPEIWGMLTSDPGSTFLWSTYVGKPWITLTYNEKERVESWKLELLATIQASIEEKVVAEEKAQPVSKVWGEGQSQEEIAHVEEVKLAAEQEAHFKEIESQMLKESAEISSLKSNVVMNFILIEENFETEYNALGEEYTYYEMVHPDGKYSREKWVTEKSKELRVLKKKEFQRLKAQMIQEEMGY